MEATVEASVETWGNDAIRKATTRPMKAFTAVAGTCLSVRPSAAYWHQLSRIILSRLSPASIIMCTTQSLRHSHTGRDRGKPFTRR